jgi:hypothetical protein
MSGCVSNGFSLTKPNGFGLLLLLLLLLLLWSYMDCCLDRSSSSRACNCRIRMLTWIRFMTALEGHTNVGIRPQRIS